MHLSIYTLVCTTIGRHVFSWCPFLNQIIHLVNSIHATLLPCLLMNFIYIILTCKPSVNSLYFYFLVKSCRLLFELRVHVLILYYFISLRVFVMLIVYIYIWICACIICICYVCYVCFMSYLCIVYIVSALYQIVLSSRISSQ